MSYLVLARKWRPQTFEQVVGQQGVIRTLQNAIRLERVGHAYLFCGARGVGKTTVARLLAKALNCDKGPTPEPDNTCPRCQEINEGRASDVFEIDGASNTGVDDVRALRENVRYLPGSSRFKIYIIDEVHMLSTSAFNALLKTLEEPPAHVKFIFATTEPHKIPLTVLSRCQRFDFKRLPAGLIEKHLRRVLEAEGARVEDGGLHLIAREAAGSMRDALSLADQVMAFAGDDITSERVAEALGLTGDELFFEVIEHLLAGRGQELVEVVDRLFTAGHDLKRFVEGLLWHVRNLLLYRTLDSEADKLVDALAETRSRLSTQAKKAERVRWYQIFDVMSRALEDLARHPVPRLVVETALLRLATLEPLADLASLVQKVEQLAGSGDGSGGGGRPAGGIPTGGARASGQRTEARRHGSRPPPAPAPQATDAAGTAAATEPGPVPEGFSPEWARLVAFVSRKRPGLGSVLNHAVPLEVGPGRVRLALEGNSFFAEQLQGDGKRREMEKLLEEFFATPTRLVIEERRPGQGTTLAQAWEDMRQADEQKLREQSLAHPMVQEAIRVFGASVEQVRPKPEVEG